MLDWSRVRERVAIDLLRWMPKGTFSRGVGWLSRRKVPRPLRKPIYGGFARRVGADLSQLDRPLDAFERFDDFFTRPLAPGARPVDEAPDAVLSPVDGVVSEIGIAEGGRLIQCKGLDYTVRGLLADSAESRHFEGGAYATLYLAPRDYHRIHAPVAGRITGYRHIPGAFFPVNPLSVRNVSGLFSINERLVTYLDTDVGRVAVVKVAATGVGHITLSYDGAIHTHKRGVSGRRGFVQRYNPEKPVGAAEELAMFHLGSTVILLFEPGRVALDGQPGDVVRVGRRIGKRMVRTREAAA
jgi:phosphatidylserine decarboxylase